MLVYRKFYNRSMSLFVVEYWYAAERYDVYEWTGGQVYYDPLFFYERGKAVSVYYDVKREKTNPARLAEYMQQNPKVFKQILAKYDEAATRIHKLCSEKKPERMSLLFDLMRQLWPGL